MTDNKIPLNQKKIYGLQDKCAVCKEIGELTQHEVVEAPKDEQDRIISISICPKCHDNHEK